MNNEEFRKHFEIDHVKPIALFNVSTKEDQYEAFKWQNCRSSLITKNRRQGAKRDVWGEIMQELRAMVFVKYELLFV